MGKPYHVIQFSQYEFGENPKWVGNLNGSGRFSAEFSGLRLEVRMIDPLGEMMSWELNLRPSSRNLGLSTAMMRIVTQRTGLFDWSFSEDKTSRKKAKSENALRLQMNRDFKEDS